MQLPATRRHIRALGDAFYNCEEVDWSIYLHQVVENKRAELNIEANYVGDGRFWHRKYWDNFNRIPQVKQEELPVFYCPECLAIFEMTKVNKKYCSRACCNTALGREHRLKKTK